MQTVTPDPVMVPEATPAPVMVPVATPALVTVPVAKASPSSQVPTAEPTRKPTKQLLIYWIKIHKAKQRAEALDKEQLINEIRLLSKTELKNEAKKCDDIIKGYGTQITGWEYVLKHYEDDPKQA